MLRRTSTTAEPDVVAPSAPPPPPAGEAPARPPRRRLRGAAAGLPRPLAFLLVAVALAGVSYALLNPAWQAPDEDVHFSYVQTLSELHRLPALHPGPSLSAGQVDAMQAMNNDPIVFLPFARPEWNRESYERWRLRARHDRQDDAGGPNAASSYPPAYYLYEVPGYLLAGGGATAIDHLYSARLWSVLWLLVTTCGVWLLAGELFGRRRELQLVAGASVGLWPMVDFMSSAVNPDSMLYALSALTLWLGVKILRRGLTPGRGAGFAACVGLAMVTKATALALFPPALFVAALGLWRLLRGRDVRRVAWSAIGLAAAFLVFVGTWKAIQVSLHRPAYGQAAGVAHGATNWREFLSYTWQYYLPRMPWMHPVHFTMHTLTGWPAYNVWMATGWATFGWVTIYFPAWTYVLFFAITVLVALVAAIGAIRLLRRLRGTAALRSGALPIAAFFAIALVVLLAGLHLAEYQARSPTNQGRYLFPLAGIAGSAVALGVTALPRRAQRPAVGAVLGGLVVFQLFALGLLGSHYLAV